MPPRPTPKHPNKKKKAPILVVPIEVESSLKFEIDKEEKPANRKKIPINIIIILKNIFMNVYSFAKGD